MAITLAKEELLSFSLSCDRKSPSCQRIMWLHRSLPYHKSPTCSCLVVIDLAEGEILSFQFITWPHVTTWSKGSLHHKSPSCQVSWSQALCKRKNFVFRLSRVLTWLGCQRVMWSYGWVSLVIRDYLAKLSDQRPFGRGDIKLSIIHVTSRYHVVIGSCDIMGEFSSS